MRLGKIKISGNEPLTIEIYYSKKLYVIVRRVSEEIGLTKGQIRSELRRVREDIVLKQGVERIERMTAGGLQSMTHLEIGYLPIWLSSINRKSLTDTQYHNLMSLLNWSLSIELDLHKHSSNNYEWEALLRDEIYELGSFDNHRIIDKEVVHDYGIIDLLANDEKEGLMGIELKKNKNYNNVILQCRRHKEGLKKKFGMDIRIAICTLDKSVEFLNRARKEGFVVYEYTRVLKLNKIV